MKALLLFILSLIFLIAGFFPQLISLTNAWLTEEYSHGYFIPVIAAVIGWHRLTENPPHLTGGNWLGLLVVLSGLSCHVMAQLSAFEPLSYYGFLIAVVGLCIAFFGNKLTLIIWPALFYLVFCIPLPRLIEVALSAKLQLLSSSLGVFILQSFGISVFQDGNIIDLGHHKLQVVEACNGLRYLFPLMSLSFLVAFLLDNSMWKRVVIFLSSIPIAIGMNALRIAWVGMSVNWGGEKMAEGAIHDLQGWTIFLLCLAVLFIETRLLILLGSNKGTLRYEYFGPASGPIVKNAPPLKSVSFICVVLCLSFLALQFSGIIQNRPQIKPQNRPFVSFPLNFEQWQGQQSTLGANIINELKVTDYLSNNYSRENDVNPINLYMAYYNEQRIGVSIHSPANCIPGSGWKIANRKVIPVEIDNRTIPMSRMIIQKDGAELLVYYWFFQRGRIINDQYGAKFYLLVDSILKNRSDGALIRLTTEVEKGKNKDQADQRIIDFLEQSFPTIENYIPD